MGGGAAGSGGCPAGGMALGSGCPNHEPNSTIASAGDAAVLSCETVRGCKVWRILTNCADQALTAGTDAATHLPACVCKPAGAAPGGPDTLYVDPRPPAASFMTNAPTGALQPPSCRLRRLRDALAATTATFTRVVTIHEADTSKHFADEFKDPVANTYAAAPLIVPPGVELTTSSAGGFGPARVNIYLFGGDGPRVVLSNGSKLSGFALIGSPSETAPEGITYTTDILGCSSGGASVFDLGIAGTGTGTQQTGIHVAGNCALTADRVSIANVARGVIVEPGATFTGTHVDGIP